MICPVCEMGVLQPETDEDGLMFSICDYCQMELVTPKNAQYNKAKFLAKKGKRNGNTEC